MKQCVFYRWMVSGNKVYALRTLGYTEGGIGLFKDPMGWVGTHIPTGARITPYSSYHKTAKQALLESESIIANSEDIIGVIQKARSKKGYNAFLSDRSKQLLIDGKNSCEE